MDVSAAWNDAEMLRDAWFLLAPRDLKDQYRDSGQNPNRRAWLEDLMHRELIGRICDGELLAIGFRTEPGLSAGPELIPVFVFVNLHGIDWGKSSVHNVGRAYEEIRIAVAERTRGDLEDLPRPKPKGRPSVGPVLREIVRELRDAGQLTGLSRKEQETRMREHARDKHPTLFPKGSQPSRSKILEALKAEGL